MGLTEEKHVVYALTMQATTATSTEYFTRNIDMSHYHDVSFIVCAGAVDASGTIFVESVPTATGSSSAGTYITGWTYRALSAGATENSTGGGDTFGTITDGTTAGFVWVTASSNYMYVIDVPAAALSTAQAVRLDILGASTGFQCGVIAVLNPRYPQNAQVSVLSDYTTL
jgi:hypothetical protein